MKFASNVPGVFCAVASLAAAMAVIGDAPTTRAASVPAFDHVFVIVMENHAYTSVVGSSSAPYFNSLIERFNYVRSDSASGNSRANHCM